jgi:hypothetical protein
MKMAISPKGLHLINGTKTFLFLEGIKVQRTQVLLDTYKKNSYKQYLQV